LKNQVFGNINGRILFGLLSLLINLLTFTTNCRAQISFEKVIDTLGSAQASCVQQTFDGGYILCGTSYLNGNDALFAKLDSLGGIEWIKSFSGLGIDGALFVSQLADSGFIALAHNNLGLNTRSWLIRLDRYGDSLWTQQYSLGSGSTEPFGMAISYSGHYAITGNYQTLPPLNSYDTFLILTDSNGQILYSDIYITSQGSQGMAVCNSLFGGYFVSGSKTITSNSSDILLIRTNSIGDTIWTKTYDGSYSEIAFSVNETSDNGCIIGGAQFNGMAFNMALIKTDSIGGTLWSKTFFDSVETFVRSVAQMPDDGYIIGGNIASTNTMADMYLVRTNSVGDTIWTRKFGGYQVDRCNNSSRTNDGGFILVGWTTSFGNGGIYVVKTDSLGNVLTTHTQELNPENIVRLFPNPNDGNFTLQFEQMIDEPYLLEVQNINGQILFSQMMMPALMQNVEVGFLPSGCYIVSMRFSDQRINRKLIIY